MKFLYGRTEFDFEQDVKKDAILTYGAMRSMFPRAGILLGLGALEAYARVEWLKTQPEEYIKKVSDAVMQIENGDKSWNL